MSFRKPQPKQPNPCLVQLALFPLEPPLNPLDSGTAGFDPSPMALELDGGEPGACRNRCRPRFEKDTCPQCGQPLIKGSAETSL